MSCVPISISLSLSSKLWSADVCSHISVSGKQQLAELHAICDVGVLCVPLPQTPTIQTCAYYWSVWLACVGSQWCVMPSFLLVIWWLVLGSAMQCVIRPEMTQCCWGDIKIQELFCIHNITWVCFSKVPIEHCSVTEKHHDEDLNHCYHSNWCAPDCRSFNAWCERIERVDESHIDSWCEGVDEYFERVNNLWWRCWLIFWKNIYCECVESQFERMNIVNVLNRSLEEWILWICLFIAWKE